MGELPKGWSLSTLGECFMDIRNGTTLKQNKDKNGFPVSRIETIQNGRFDLSRVKHIESIDEDQVDLFKYQVGDIAFSHINSYEHVGKTALYYGAPNILIHGMNLLRLRLGHNNIYPKYAYLYMQSLFFRQKVREKVNHAVNQVSINQTNLSKVPIIVCPINEQRRIVAKLEKLLAKVNPVQLENPSFEKSPKVLLSKVFGLV